MYVYKKPDLFEEVGLWLICLGVLGLLLIGIFLLVFGVTDTHASGPKSLVINGKSCGSVSTLRIDANEVKIRTLGELKCGDQREVEQ